jgi:hypothetical protein
MSLSVQSFRKVFYDLRPGKQIERRILLDSLQHLIELGFPIRDYRYVGFGSIFFYDFSMLYRYLGIRDMVSLEIDSEIEKRVKYNRPYDNIDVRIESAASYIPNIDRDRRHIVWFDYDQMVSMENLADVTDVMFYLRSGSVFLITVDAFPPTEYRSASKLRRHVERDLRSYLPDKYPTSRIKVESLSELSRDLIATAIKKGLAARSVDFRPLWSLTYNDSRPMYTFGGMVVDNTDDATLLGHCNDFFYRCKFSDAILTIEVPRLTRKERIALDHDLPLSDRRTFDIDFGINEQELAAYALFHRYFPTYSELF